MLPRIRTTAMKSDNAARWSGKSRRRAWSAGVAIVVLATACSDAQPTAPVKSPGAPSALDKIAPAGLLLGDATAQFGQSSRSTWGLSETGSVDSGSSTVTWTITVTEDPTGTDHLIVDGSLTLTNPGSGTATLGNIVANLQTQGDNGWVTVSSDIADATDGDDATTAQVDAHGSSEDLSSFDENAASGALAFMDADSHTTFPLVPQVTIDPGATVHLLFAASYDNDVLGLAAGTDVRMELLFSFGNANAHGTSAHDVDINGSGAIDPDEANVRTIPGRITGSVPAPQATSSTPALSDTGDDITTTGTVTFDNPEFDLGPTGGTVTVHYDGGTDGGSITNRAHLMGGGFSAGGGGFSFDGVDLETSDTQTIEGTPTCSPGAPGCGWQDGDMVTYRQDDWPAEPYATELSLHYDNVYYATGVLEVGIPGSGGYSILFSDAQAVLDYLPTSGDPGVLDTDLLDPTTSAAGAFGGEVVALRLNVDYSDAGVLDGAAHLAFGDLTLRNFSSLPDLNGMTVRQFESMVESLLGGGTALYSLADLYPITASLNGSFAEGASQWAQDHLIVCSPGAPGCGWQAGDMLTYGQDSWSAGTPATVLTDHYDAIYGSNYGVVEVGVPGSAGYSMQFSASSSVLAYLPAGGSVGPLTADLVNPATSPSGQFGGDVLALQLDVDYADAGDLNGTAGLTFGDLTLCGFSTLSALNGMTVRQFLGVVNTLLGGGTGAYDIAMLEPITSQLSRAFDSGNVSVFTQDHVVNGSCP